MNSLASHLSPWGWIRALAAASIVAGCSAPPSLPTDSRLQQWSGRMGLQIHDPHAQEQSFSASFVLQGTATHGQLDVFNPLGSQIAQLQWQPGQAQLRQGNEVRTSSSLQELVALSLGTGLPVEAMFDWLQGQPTQASGWNVDLSQRAQGRITAKRTAPPPEATLRLILQP